jgi:hypothetical protein
MRKEDARGYGRVCKRGHLVEGCNAYDCRAAGS